MERLADHVADVAVDIGDHRDAGPVFESTKVRAIDIAGLHKVRNHLHQQLAARRNAMHRMVAAQRDLARVEPQPLDVELRPVRQPAGIAQHLIRLVGFGERRRAFRAGVVSGRKQRRGLLRHPIGCLRNGSRRAARALGGQDLNCGIAPELPRAKIDELADDGRKLLVGLLLSQVFGFQQQRLNGQRSDRLRANSAQANDSIIDARKPESSARLSSKSAVTIARRKSLNVGSTGGR